MKTRKKILPILLVAASLILTSGLAQALHVRAKAPDFALDSLKGGKLTASSLKGKNVLT